MNVGKILVPLDGSTFAEAALWKALEIAEGATITVLRATEVDPSADAPEMQLAVLREAQEYLRRIIKRLDGKRTGCVEGHVWCGPPASAIVEVARTEKIDLIVMATHGRSGLEHLVLGSVVESVLRNTPVPVLVLRPEGAKMDVLVGARAAGGEFRV